MWIQLKKQPKESITLQQFYDAVGVVAKENNEDYFSVTIKLSSHDGLLLSGYINGLSHLKGKTIEEVCEKLRNYRKPPEPSPIKEVIF